MLSGYFLKRTISASVRVKTHSEMRHFNVFTKTMVSHRPPPLTGGEDTVWHCQRMSFMLLFSCHPPFPPVLCSRKIPDKEPCSPPTLLHVLLLPLKRPLLGAVPGHMVAPHGGGGKAEITSALERWRCGASSGSSLCCSGPSRPAQPCCSHHSERCIKQVINPKGNGLSGQAASHLMSSLII